MAHSELEDLLQDARSEGSLDSAGTFTVDFATAISKMRAFQVENQFHYVNRLVRAGVFAGAPQVHITTSASKTRVQFETCAFPPKDLEALFEQILQQSRPAMREVAVATNLCLALKPARVELCLNDGENLRLLHFTGKVEGDAFLPHAEIHREARAPLGTTFQLTRSLGASASFWGTQSPESLNVLRSFRYTPVSIDYNGSVIDRTAYWGATSAAPGWLSGVPTISVKANSMLAWRKVAKAHHACEIRTYHSQPGLNGVGLSESRASSFLSVGEPPTAQDRIGEGACYLALGLQIDPEAPSTARFIYGGETVQTFPVRLGLPGIEILMSAHGLNLDAGGERIAEDDVFKARWEEAKNLVGKLQTALQTAYPRTAPQSLATQAMFDEHERWKSYFLA